MTPLGHCVTCANMSRSHHFGTPLEELRQPANLGCPSCDVIRRGIEGATGAELSELDPDSSFWIVMDPYGAYQFHIEVKLGPHTMDLELYTLETSPVRWPGIETGRHVSMSSASESCLRLAQGWYKDCVEGHTKCEPQLTPLLPTRVLFLGDNDQALRLHVAEKGERAQYAVLSHCWGGHQPLTTEESTLKERMKAIESAALPRTFSDAIKVTRSLLIDYLWIDSLCIIQDSTSDWEVEASRISLIYKDAALMISASSSPNGSHGCFVTSADRSVSPIAIRYEDSDGLQSQIFVRAFGERSEAISHVSKHAEKWRFGRFVGHLSEHSHGTRHPTSPVPEGLGEQNILPATSGRSLLSLRAWTLQERLLARRILHFTGTELAWECRTSLACECQIGSANTAGYKSKIYSNYRFLKPVDDDESVEEVAPQEDSAYRMLMGEGAEYALQWRNLVEEVTHRRLTFATDRLAVLSGLAAMHANRHQDQYLFGLWRSTLLMDLVWQPGSRELFDPQNVVPSQRQSPGFAPSWTWASITGSVVWPLDIDESEDTPFSNRLSYDDSVFHVTILETVSSPKGKDPYGYGTGSITLRGVCIPGTLHRSDPASEDAPLYSFQVPYGSDAFSSDDDSEDGESLEPHSVTAQMDVNPKNEGGLDRDALDGRDYTCLAICSTNSAAVSDNQSTAYYLLLEPVLSKIRTYRRVGTAKGPNLLLCWDLDKATVLRTEDFTIV